MIRSLPGRSVTSMLPPSGRNAMPQGCDSPVAIRTTRSRSPSSVTSATGLSESPRGTGATASGRLSVVWAFPSSATTANIGIVSSQAGRRRLFTRPPDNHATIVVPNRTEPAGVARMPSHLRLARISSDPTIGLRRISPEDLFRHRDTLAREVLPEDANDRGIGPFALAIGEIAGENETVLAEDAPHLIDSFLKDQSILPYGIGELVAPQDT